jgi:hypothetical protein
VRQDLRTIYSRVGGVPDLTRLDKKTSGGLSRLLLKIIFALGIISVLAWTGFFFFTRGLFQDNESLKLTIDGPQEIKSGEEATFTFRYENTGGVPIASLAMQLQTPDSFHIFSSVPEPTEHTIWDIGALGPGSDGAISITGVFLAEVPSSQRIQGLFTYKPANFNSDFQDIVSSKTDILDSVIALSFTGPEKAMAGDESEYIVNIQNTGKETVYNLRVDPSMGQNFAVAESAPKPDEGQVYWTIPSLKPGELTAISIKGAFSSSASGTQKLGTDVGFIDNDIFVKQASEEMTTEVVGGSISFSVIVNGSSQNQSAELGETLRLSIDFANNGADPIKNLEFALKTSASNGSGVPINWQDANLGNGTRKGDTMTWNGDDIQKLMNLDPGDSGVIDIGLPLVDSLSSKLADNFTIEVSLQIGNMGTYGGARIVESTPITISLNSDVQALSYARYFSDNGDTIGEGPLPPRVGETTGYRVYWSVNNSLHALENIKMTTTLPADVAWLESSDANIGSISYSPTTRQVVWAIAKLPTDLQNAGAWFSVAINPNENNVGKFVKLTNVTSFEAKDTVSKASMSESLDALSTDLINDKHAKGKGVVVE